MKAISNDTAIWRILMNFYVISEFQIKIWMARSFWDVMCGQTLGYNFRILLLIQVLVCHSSSQVTAFRDLLLHGSRSIVLLIWMNLCIFRSYNLFTLLFYVILNLVLMYWLINWLQDIQNLKEANPHFWNHHCDHSLDNSEV